MLRKKERFMSKEKAVKFFKRYGIRSGGESNHGGIELRTQSVKNVLEEIMIANGFTNNSKLISDVAHLLKIIVTALTASGGGMKETMQFHDFG
jgi:hypothetical protein